MTSEYQSRPWMSSVLRAAGLYNIVWGMLAIAMPMTMLSWLGLSAGPVVAVFWQCIGMIVGVYGVGYFVASKHPYSHWPITLVGLLGKVFGPIGFCVSVVQGTLPSTMVWTIVLNDLIWWIPFAAILWGAVRFHQAVGLAYETTESDDPLRELRTNSGRRLDDLANRAPQLVMFLRHTGCTFCRQALSDLSRQRAQIEGAGVGIVLVHLGEDGTDSEDFFAKYELHDVPRISDPECRLYRQFGLDLGGFAQLLGLRVWIQGFITGILRGHSVGAATGNTSQMPGVYVYHCGQIVGGFRHDFASDRPDYVGLVSGLVSSEQPQPMTVA